MCWHKRYFKNYRHLEAGEMSQLLIAPAVLAEDQGLVLSTHSRLGILKIGPKDDEMAQWVKSVCCTSLMT